MLRISHTKNSAGRLTIRKSHWDKRIANLQMQPHYCQVRQKRGAFAHVPGLLRPLGQRLLMHYSGCTHYFKFDMCCSHPHNPHMEPQQEHLSKQRGSLWWDCCIRKASWMRPRLHGPWIAWGMDPALAEKALQCACTVILSSWKQSNLYHLIGNLLDGSVILCKTLVRTVYPYHHTLGNSACNIVKVGRISMVTHLYLLLSFM